jgi:hypothetical protein
MGSSANQGNRPATAAEIREILGPVDDQVVSSILRVEATPSEVLEAQTWLASDDYLHRQLHHTLSGRAAEVFDILESELPEVDRP